MSMTFGATMSIFTPETSGQWSLDAALSANAVLQSMVKVLVISLETQAEHVWARFARRSVSELVTGRSVGDHC